MTTFDKRETAFENKYAHDQETLFRIEARAAKLLGLWAAQEMSLTGDDADAYVGAVIVSNLKQTGVQDVVAKVSADLTAKGRTTDTVAGMMQRFMKETEQALQAQ
jgi:hypothetical protein